MKNTFRLDEGLGCIVLDETVGQVRVLRRVRDAAEAMALAREVADKKITNGITRKSRIDGVTVAGVKDAFKIVDGAVQFDGYIDGKKITERFGFDETEKMHGFASSIRTRYSAAKPNTRPRVVVDKSFGELLGQWQEACIAGRIHIPKTVRRNKSIIANLTEYFGDLNALPYMKIADDWLSYQQHRIKQGRTLKTVKIEFSLAHAVLKFAARKRRIKYNPLEGEYDKVRVKTNERYVPTPAEIQLIFDALADDNTKRMFHFLLATGLRISEACALTVGDVKPTTIRVHKNTKRDIPRSISLPLLPFDLIGDRCPDDPLLPQANGRAFQPTGFNHTLKRAAAKAGVKKMTVHSTRAAYATYSLALGKPLTEVQEQGGWRVLATMQYYVRRSIDYRGYDHYLPMWSQVDLLRLRSEEMMRQIYSLQDNTTVLRKMVEELAPQMDRMTPREQAVVKGFLVFIRRIKEATEELWETRTKASGGGD